MPSFLSIFSKLFHSTVYKLSPHPKKERNKIPHSPFIALHQKPPLSSHTWINFSREFTYFLNHNPFLNPLICFCYHPFNKTALSKIISIVHITGHLQHFFSNQGSFLFVLLTTQCALPGFCNRRQY